MDHVDPHNLFPDDGSHHDPQHHHNDDWGAAGDHDARHDHATDWEHSDAHHDHGGWDAGSHSHTDSLTVDDMHVEADGSLSLHAILDHGHVEVGDFVDMRLPNGDHVAVRVSETDPSDQSYRAVLPAEHAHSLIDHLLGEAVETGAHSVFEHLWHQAESLLCHGEVIGSDGQHLLLGGAEAGAGANGAPVFDDLGHLVGQVIGFDPTHGVNLMMTADSIMSGLADFASWAADSMGDAVTGLLQ